MKKIFMKKIFILLAVIFMAVTANAQWFVGGDLGINVSGTAHENGEIITNNTSVGFLIAPKGGYYLNEKLALGLSFAVGADFRNYPNDNLNPYSDAKSTSVQWSVNPFARYSVFTYKRFSLILEGSIGVGGAHLKDIRIYAETWGHPAYTRETITSALGISVIKVTPVLGFKLSDHFQLETGLRFLNLGYNIDITTQMEKTKNDGGEYELPKTKSIRHDFNIGFRSSSILKMSELTIGAIYKF